jgi:hypothetical protein
MIAGCKESGISVVSSAAFHNSCRTCGLMTAHMLEMLNCPASDNGIAGELAYDDEPHEL